MSGADEEKSRTLARMLLDGAPSKETDDLARILNGLGPNRPALNYPEISSAFQLAQEESRRNEMRDLTKDRDSLKQQVQTLTNSLANERAAAAEQGIKLRDLSQSLGEAREAIESSSKIISEKGIEIGELNGKLESLKRQYDELTMLRDAAKFWSDKADEHKASFVRGAIGFAVSIVLLVICLFKFWPEIFALLPKSNGEVQLSGVGVLLLLALGPVWMLRILARFTQENFALWNDSGARNTMMKTYLALVGNPDAGIQPQDRSIILGAVFRPALGQSEDGMPASIVEALTRAIDRKPG